ncbi:MAG: ACP S-malonyltransferase [Spirochaetota bacterium]|nr:ACP S-malonyltransferase [Spirochaetota bacterium]
MKICFLYPGQGAQYPGMGKDLYESKSSVRQLFDLASDACRCDARQLLFDSSEAELKETRNTQISITLMNLAVRRYLMEEGIESAACAGFSLGEWTALVDAEVLTEEEVFHMVLKRAELMTAAVDRLSLPGGSGMAAVIGLAADAVEEAIMEIEGVYPANYNSPDQTVISGSAEAVAAASEACKSAGARRVIPLKVSGPFHTPLLEDARGAFELYLQDRELRNPAKILYSNASGAAVRSVDDIRRYAALQISSPVRWTSEEANITADGYDLCIECGPGKVLTGLWKKCGAEISCLPAGTMESIGMVMEEVHNREK